MRVRVELLRPGTYQALLDHLERVRDQQGAGYYHVVHFDVHGALLAFDELQAGAESDRYTYQARFGREDLQRYDGRKRFLLLEGERDARAHLVEAGELADLLVTHQVPIAILNACQSGKQVGATETSLGSRLMQAGTQTVLAMGYSVTVSAAELLMRTLYGQLLADAELPAAIRRARLELYNSKGRRAYFNQTVDLEDWLLPVVYQRQEPRLAMREFTPEEQAAYFEREARRYHFPAPTYGFWGRDLDILQIEKRLLARRNLLLVRGMGGAGKTTLLRHLGAWWQTTHLVGQVLYFGYDETAWTRQQIMDAIARELLDRVEYARDFQPLGLGAQQAMLAQRLRAERHLLILDNLESITGAELAIQHTLPEEEREALRRLLADLVGGKTLVLLGSRGGEEWLALGTFGDNTYDLPGLDPEAASGLADAILERHGATRYREDQDLRRLIELLGGYPLALEVVLANLGRQTPAEVLAALQAGDVALDDPNADAQDKTESILRCIDYSHGNLLPEAQELLTCLAPFTSVIDTEFLPQYTDRLREQPVLTELPFERWAEVLREAANWGLLSAMPDAYKHLHLQPTLPYFLRSRLRAPERAERRRAVETAFRRHYGNLGRLLSSMLGSKDAQQKQLGRGLAGLEYENLVTALDLDLDAQDSIFNPYYALSSYLDAVQDHRRGLELGQRVVARLENYPADKLAGQLGVEFVSVLDGIAKHQLLLKRYPAAEESYQKALLLLTGLTVFDEEQRRRFSATIYHQLGRVAQERGQWQEALDYFLKDLTITSELDDEHDLGITLLSLARLWQSSGDASLPAAIAPILSITADEAEVLLRAALSDEGAQER